MLFRLLVLLLFLASGILLTAALLLSRRTRLELERHVNLVASARSAREGGSFLYGTIPLSRLNALAKRLFCFGMPYRWGVRSDAPVLLVIGGVAGAFVGLLSFRMLENLGWLAGPLAAAAFVLVPRYVLIRQQRQAEHKFMELFPTAIDSIIRMLRAGMPITSAVRSVALESEPPINKVFGSIADQVDLGVSFEKALDVASAQSGVPDFRFFSVAITLQHATGGNLAATLEILSDVIRKRRAVRLKSVAATAEVRITAYVLGGMPIMTIGLLLAIKPDYIAPLMYDPRGKIILGTAAALLLLGFGTMRQLMRRASVA